MWKLYVQQVSKTCDSLLNKKLVALQRLCYNIGLYYRKDEIEAGTVLWDISIENFGGTICIIFYGH